MKQLTKHLALSAGLLVALASCSPKLSKQKSAALTTRQDSVAYAFGVLNGQAFSEVLSHMPGDTLSRQQILAAFGDVLLGHSSTSMQRVCSRPRHVARQLRLTPSSQPTRLRRV